MNGAGTNPSVRADAGITLGLRENWQQFSLLVLINGSADGAKESLRVIALTAARWRAAGEHEVQRGQGGQARRNDPDSRTCMVRRQQFNACSLLLIPA
jgi:hypothetical protein